MRSDLFFRALSVAALVALFAGMSDPGLCQEALRAQTTDRLLICQTGGAEEEAASRADAADTADGAAEANEPTADQAAGQADAGGGSAPEAAPGSGGVPNLRDIRLKEQRFRDRELMERYLLGISILFAGLALLLFVSLPPRNEERRGG